MNDIKKYDKMNEYCNEIVISKPELLCRSINNNKSNDEKIVNDVINVIKTINIEEIMQRKCMINYYLDLNKNSNNIKDDTKKVMSHKLIKYIKMGLPDIIMEIKKYGNDNIKFKYFVNKYDNIVKNNGINKTVLWNDNNRMTIDEYIYGYCAEELNNMGTIVNDYNNHINNYDKCIINQNRINNIKNNNLDEEYDKMNEMYINGINNDYYIKIPDRINVNNENTEFTSYYNIFGYLSDKIIMIIKNIDKINEENEKKIINEMKKGSIFMYGIKLNENDVINVCDENVNKLLKIMKGRPIIIPIKNNLTKNEMNYLVNYLIGSRK